MGVSDNALARGTNYTRKSAKPSGDINLPASGHVFKKDSSFFNHSFEGGFKARDPDVFGDGYAYFVKDTAAFTKKVTYTAS